MHPKILADSGKSTITDTQATNVPGSSFKLDPRLASSPRLSSPPKLHERHCGLLFRNRRPFRVGGLKVADSVLVELITGTFVILQKQTANDDLEGIDLDFHQVALGNGLASLS